MYNKIANLIYRVEGKESRKIMITTEFQFRTRMNLMLLKFYLLERKARGLFITFDRPHQYMSRLLDINKINQEKLTYIDAVSLISGEVSQGTGKNVRFVKGPYQIGLFKNLVGRCFNPTDPSRQIVDINNIDFIIIDDITALSIYNEHEEVEEFVDNFFAFSDSLNTFVVALALDAKYDGDIYNLMGEYCDDEILVDPANNTVRLSASKKKGRKATSGFDMIPRPVTTANRIIKDVIV